MRFALSLILLAAGPALARADDGAPTGFVGAGVGFAPRFEGASDVDAIPLLVGRVAWGGITVELDGTEARLDVSAINGLGFGPAVRFRGGRDDDVDSAAVARLDEIDDAVEVGGFLRYGRPFGLASADEGVVRLDVLADATGAHSGVVATLTAAYTFRPVERLGLTIAAATRLVSDDYAETYSNVSAAGAAASGLTPFEASGGLRDVGLSLVATYAVSGRWGVFGIVSASRLVGDAADSPIVKREGEATQVFGGLALTYGF